MAFFKNRQLDYGAVIAEDIGYSAPRKKRFPRTVLALGVVLVLAFFWSSYWTGVYKPGSSIIPFNFSRILSGTREEVTVTDRVDVFVTGAYPSWMPLFRLPKLSGSQNLGQFHSAFFDLLLPGVVVVGALLDLRYWRSQNVRQ